MKIVGTMKLVEIVDIAIARKVSTQQAQRMLDEGLIEPPAGRVGFVRIWTEDQLAREVEKQRKLDAAPKDKVRIKRATKVA